MYGGSVRRFFPIYKWLVRYRYFYGAIVLGRRLVGTSDKDIDEGPLLTGCVVLYIAFVFDFYSYVDPSIVSFSYIETFTVAVLFAANVLLGKSYLPVSRNAGGYGYSWGYLYPCSEECLWGRV